MKKRVLLISPKPSSSAISVTRLPPLGILGIASYLRAKNIHVDVWDQNINPESFYNYRDYDLVGISVNIGNISNGIKTVRMVKKVNPAVEIVFGGPFCIADPKALMKIHEINAIAMGEGEIALYRYLNSEIKTDIPGFWVRKSGRWFFTGEPEWIDDLDTLPFPALDLVELKHYFRPVSLARPISTIITSRGCPFACIFCFPSMGKKWRARSAQNVVDEMEWQVNTLGVKEICIEDDNFSLSKERVLEICELIIERRLNVKIQLRSGLRADLVTRELVKKLRAAGTWLISLSPESGNPESLERIKKGFTLEQVQRVIDWCKEENIRTFACYIMGFPWESKADLLKTVNCAFQFDSDFIQISRATPLPGTEFYEVIKNELAAGDNNSELYDMSFLSTRIRHKTKVNSGDLERIIRHLYFKYYFRPCKILAILKLLPVKHIVRMAIYSVVSGNI